jgi:polar amino acid transport system substrate-binding protein
MKKLSLILTGLMLILLSTTESYALFGSKKTKDKVYKIATDAAFAPFSFEKDGKYTGIDVDILDAVAKLEGFKYELKPMNFNGIIPGVVAGQLDGAIAGMSIDEKRKKVLDFSSDYYNSGTVAVVKASNTTINTISDFAGKRFAVKKGTTGSQYAEANVKKLNASIRYFDDSPSMFQEVINGNADITFEDLPVIAYKISLDSKSELRIVGNRLDEADYGFAVKKGKNQELLEKFNAGLKKLKETGEYDKILDKYR